MCGIFGIYNINAAPVDVDRLRWSTQQIKHRGPDDEGYLLFSTRTGKAVSCAGEDTDQRLGLPPLQDFAGQDADLAFGFRRLAILDLSESGHQPMSSADGSLWIVYNGEIYNYLELRQELSHDGYLFRSQTDTEVILAAYQKWGMDCLQHFNGMWAFALWDANLHRLFVARDRFGVKPLYYASSPQQFAFGSEIKTLVGKRGVAFRPAGAAIHRFLTVGKLPSSLSGQTFFEEIQALPPGHALCIEQGKVRDFGYYVLPQEPVAPDSLPFDQAVEQYRDLLQDSVRLRLRSDVSIGTCLSGGIDSSSIVCLINRLMRDEGRSTAQVGAQQRTFSAVYDVEGPFNEKQYIEKVIAATGAEKNYTIPRADDLRQEASRMIWHQDELFPNTSMLSQWFVMKKVHDRGVTVLLDGQGADECLGGYRPFHYLFADTLRDHRYTEVFQQLSAINHNTNTSGWKHLAAGLALSSPSALLRWAQQCRLQLQKSSDEYLNPSFRGVERRGDQPGEIINNLKDHLKNLIQDTSLPILLRYEDRNAMAFGVEARVPFLDYRLVEFSFEKSARWRIVDGWTKYILRRAMQGTVPEEILWRKDKVGFETPEPLWLREWMRKDQSLFAGGALCQDYLNLTNIRSRINQWLKDEARIPPLWRWINLELWLQVWSQA